MRNNDDIPSSRRAWLKQATALAAVAVTPSIWLHAALKPHLSVKRNPGCSCCEKWVEHMRAAGFEIDISDDPKLSELKDRLHVPADVRACHTSQGEGYVFEGHIPAATIQRFLDERPRALGLAVGGMPAGSPGMESSSPVAYDIMAFDQVKSWVYEKHAP